AFSGQKMMGPTGIGVLYGKEKHLQELDPVVFGGGMIRNVGRDASTWADTPHKFEAGTPHIAGAIGLGAAISYIKDAGLDDIAAREKKLAADTRRALAEFPYVQLYGPADTKDAAGIVSFTMEGAHAHDVAEILSQENIAVRAGHHCALPLMNHFGVSGTVRASFYLYNTEEDVERLVKGVEHARRIFHT
ncbi:MAG: cysteine desulfurase / selenocysteine lyase, partial [Parcubacteria group bacterium Gr01-1014_70]